MLLSLLFCASLASAEDEFPNRAVYPDVPVIETEDLYRNLDKHVVVDVRSRYEYDTLHIRGAGNIPLNSSDFIEQVRTLASSHPGKTIAFYCNGKTCRKSYKAARRARKYHIDNVVAYDAGIFDWARAHPDQAVLLGQSPVPAGRLISTADFKKHLLDPDAFLEKAREPGAIVLDIRDIRQREGISLLPPGREERVPLDNEKLRKYVEQAQAEGRPLLIYDAVGKQVRWLQYFLEQAGLNNYWFMKGGIRSYLAELQSDYR
ncbi:MAG: rhodanese-like domain-containing protein [Gammaproteobacteria bacterium]|nr:MAG: rhodanese-like domain-containing protein [Gammaproteobacteria bacterium]